MEYISTTYRCRILMFSLSVCQVKSHMNAQTVRSAFLTPVPTVLTSVVRNASV